VALRYRAINSLPRVALVPIIIIVFGLDDLSKVVTALTQAFFIVFFNTCEGARSVDRDYMMQRGFLAQAVGRSLVPSR
jgi:ABC-type nitrate/sulfonate/bicarbonate transport system permease component